MLFVEHFTVPDVDHLVLVSMDDQHFTLDCLNFVDVLVEVAFRWRDIITLGFKP